jgi:uncharacterized protein (DUF433 family)
MHWEIDSRIMDINAARDVVSFDPAIRNGEPCVRDTRIPVYTLEKMIRNGASKKELTAEYALSMRQIDLAVLYVELHPRKGRPTREETMTGFNNFGDVARADVESLGEFPNCTLPTSR